MVYQHGLMFKAEVLSYLGTGYVLYFFFLKCLILVSGIISIMTLYIAYTYFMGSNCTLDNNCASNFILMFSIANYGLQANHEFRVKNEFYILSNKAKKQEKEENTFIFPLFLSFLDFWIDFS